MTTKAKKATGNNGKRSSSSKTTLILTQPTLSVEDLRAAVTGRVIGPDDPEYDHARLGFYGGTDHRPAAIVRVADAADVERVVLLARQTRMELAVRSGGHSHFGYNLTPRAIMIDLKEMRALEIDVEGRTAWAEAGLTAGEYTTAANAHGLATPFGDTGSVGLGGITLGGGVGYLVRKYGLTIDDLLAADVVTADGQLLHVDAETHPDLFWAIRGGGGNFGVATRFQYRLHPVDMVVGGMLVLPATAETIRGFVAAAEAAPEELSTIANIMPAPPMPFLPPEQHGQLVILGMMTYAGPVEDGERVMAPFRALATPLADMVRPIHYPEMYPPEEAEYHPLGIGRTLFVDKVDQAVAELIVSSLKAAKLAIAVAQIRVLGGAMARVPAGATAFAHRQRRIMVNTGGVYEHPEEKETATAWAEEFAAALNQGDNAVYVNFLADDGPARVHDAYPPATWERLAAIKQRYDPTNLFQHNQNIPPKEEE